MSRARRAARCGEAWLRAELAEARAELRAELAEARIVIAILSEELAAARWALRRAGGAEGVTPPADPLDQEVADVPY